MTRFTDILSGAPIAAIILVTSAANVTTSNLIVDGSS